MVEDETATRSHQKVGPGCTVFVPESRFHSTLNTGDGPMQLFVVYSPAGPELPARAAGLQAGADQTGS
jgi:oxalate decarboxylase/phosphoglucose isomerase-like protein (cupin superfamily)